MRKEGYDNYCSRIIYEQEELEKYLTCKLLRAKRAEFFGEKLALEPLNLLYPFKLSVKNTQNKKSRTTNRNFKEGLLNSRTFQGQIHFQGLFKENPKFKDFSRTVGTLELHIAIHSRLLYSETIVHFIGQDELHIAIPSRLLYSETTVHFTGQDKLHMAIPFKLLYSETTVHFIGQDDLHIVIPSKLLCILITTVHTTKKICDLIQLNYINCTVYWSHTNHFIQSFHLDT